MKSFITKTNSVLLLGIDNPIGLSIIRELYANKVDVYGLAHQKQSIGFYSRGLKEGFVRKKSESEFLEQMLGIINAHAIPFIMAISENDIVFLNCHRQLFLDCKILIPSKNQMDIVLNKTKTYAAAKQVGINVPRNWGILKIEDIFKDILFPVVLKWQNPQAIITKLNEFGIEFIKSEYAYSLIELKKILERYERVGEFPEVQEYCPGYGIGHFIFMYDGKPMLIFQHKRIHEWPPEGGISSCCQSISLNEHEKLIQKSIRLLRKINWVGVAMVEYRYDPKTDTEYLMEINGRFWGSLPLAHQCKAEFAWLTYLVLGKNTIPKIKRPLTEIQCRFMVPEIKRLFRILFQQDRIQNKAIKFALFPEVISFFLGFFNMKTRYYVFTLSDPLPFFFDLLQIFKKAIKFYKKKDYLINFIKK